VNARHRLLAFKKSSDKGRRFCIFIDGKSNPDDVHARAVVRALIRQPREIIVQGKDFAVLEQTKLQ